MSAGFESEWAGYHIVGFAKYILVSYVSYLHFLSSVFHREPSNFAPCKAYYMSYRRTEILGNLVKRVFFRVK